MSNQDNSNRFSSCAETEFIEGLLSCESLPWKNDTQSQLKNTNAQFKEYLAEQNHDQQVSQDAQDQDYGFVNILDDVIDIVKLMASCVEETNNSKWEVDRLIKEKALIEQQAKAINSDKSNVKQAQQEFANQVLLPQLTKLDNILDKAEPTFQNDSVLEAHVKGIRILERAFSNNMISAGLLTQQEVDQAEQELKESEAKEPEQE